MCILFPFTLCGALAYLVFHGLRTGWRIGRDFIDTTGEKNGWSQTTTPKAEAPIEEPSVYGTTKLMANAAKVSCS